MPTAEIVQRPTPSHAQFDADNLLLPFPRTLKASRYARDDPSDPTSTQDVRSCACSRTANNEQNVYTFKLDKVYAIDAILVVGEKANGLAGGFDIYIGENLDFNANPKCPGGPFLTCDTPPCDHEDLTGNW